MKNKKTKNMFPWKTVILVIAVIILSVCITLFLVKKTKQQEPNKIKSVVRIDTKTALSPTELPANTPSCDVTDSTFCNVLANLKSALAASNYAGFLTYHNLQTITCDPDGMFVAVCENIAKGVVKQGYGIGYNESEGTLTTQENYVASVSEYIKTNGPFTYQGSLVDGNKGVAVFLNSAKDHILVFPMKRSGDTWKMDHILLGGTFGNNAFTTLSDTLLNFVQ